jgi:hypothetical protein
MANCWDNVIGVRGYCDEQTPSSGLYINDLTGLDIATLDKGVNSELNTAYALILSRIGTAANLMENEAKGFMADRWMFATSKDDATIGFYQEQLTALSASANYRGIGLRFQQVDYLALSVTAVTLLVNFTGNFNVLVVDLRTGQTLDTITVAAVANRQVRVVTNKTYESYGQMLNLAFVYNATTVPSYQTSLYPTYGCGGCSRSSVDSGMVLERAFTIPTGGGITEQSITGDSYTAGLSVQYNVQCSFRSFMCAQMPALGYPLLYKTAVLLMQEMKYSKRLNGVITYNREAHEELETYFQSKYDDYMSKYFQGANLRSGLCFACNSRVRKSVLIP